jgi:hypothetical protein
MLNIAHNRKLVSAAAENLFNPLFDLGTCEKHAPAAALALQADISAESNHSPVAASTRVRLAQANPVKHTQVGVLHVLPL